MQDAFGMHSANNVLSIIRCATRWTSRETTNYFSTVDKIEDAKSLEFNKVQQRSTSCPYLNETEAVENRALSREARNCLGRRCATLERIFRFNRLEGRGC